MNSQKLNIKIFADGANIDQISLMNNEPLIQGLTTNPTLMRKAGISNYKNFAKEVLEIVKNKSISFEVFSDDFQEMEMQAKIIASWQENVFVKIPITNTKGVSSQHLIKKLTDANIKVNVTAILTIEQVKEIIEVLNPNVPSYISIFAGRIADTGIDPEPIMEEALTLIENYKKFELIWASPRELLNVIQANNIGCHIITATTDIINKIKLIGYPLEKYSLDTVNMFYEDAKKAGYTL